MKITHFAWVLALVSPSCGADVDPPRGARAKRHLRGLQADHPHHDLGGAGGADLAALAGGAGGADLAALAGGAGGPDLAALAGGAGGPDLAALAGAGLDPSALAALAGALGPQGLSGAPATGGSVVSVPESSCAGMACGEGHPQCCGDLACDGSTNMCTAPVEVPPPVSDGTFLTRLQDGQTHADVPWGHAYVNFRPAHLGDEVSYVITDGCTGELLESYSFHPHNTDPHQFHTTESMQYYPLVNVSATNIAEYEIKMYGVTTAGASPCPLNVVRETYDSCNPVDSVGFPEACPAYLADIAAYEAITAFGACVTEAGGDPSGCAPHLDAILMAANELTHLGWPNTADVTASIHALGEGYTTEYAAASQALAACTASNPTTCSTATLALQDVVLGFREAMDQLLGNTTPAPAPTESPPAETTPNPPPNLAMQSAMTFAICVMQADFNPSGCQTELAAIHAAAVSLRQMGQAEEAEGIEALHAAGQAYTTDYAAAGEALSLCMTENLGDTLACNEQALALQQVVLRGQQLLNGPAPPPPPPAPLNCDGALEAFLQLTEPSDNDIFVGANESSPVPGDSYNWAENRLCAGNDNANCSDPIGSAYGMWTYLPGDETYMTDEYYILGEYGSLTLTSIEYPGSTPHASVTGGTGCFAGLTGQMTAIYVEDENYYNYDLSAISQPPADLCDGALENFLQLTEPSDTDIFVGANESSPVPGDSYNWAGNRLCAGNDNANCSDPIGSAYGMYTYLPDDDTYITDEYYILGEYGSLTLTSIEYPGATPYASVTGGTGCFAGLTGQMTAIYVEGEDYYNYDLSALVRQPPAETTTSQLELSSDECDAALETFLLLTEPFDTDIFVGSDADSPVPGDSYNWAGNRLCLGNDNANCSDPIGSAYGMSTYLPDDDTFVTDEFYVLGQYGTLALTSIEYPGATPYAFVTGGTGCFAGASGQTTAIVVGDDEYYNYDLSGVVRQSPPETPPAPTGPSCAALDQGCTTDVAFGQGTCCGGLVCWYGDETCTPEVELDGQCLPADVDIPCNNAAISCCAGLECRDNGACVAPTNPPTNPLTNPPAQPVEAPSTNCIDPGVYTGRQAVMLPCHNNSPDGECCAGWECQESGACVESAPAQAPTGPSCAPMDEVCTTDVEFGQGNCCDGLACWPGENTCGPELCIEAEGWWPDVLCNNAAIDCCAGLECGDDGACVAALD